MFSSHQHNVDKTEKEENFQVSSCNNIIPEPAAQAFCHPAAEPGTVYLQSSGGGRTGKGQCL